MEKSNWQLKEHDDVERPYWEITNGPISMCVDDEDITEEHITAMTEIVNALNSGGIHFRSENALEVKQHTEIMQLQEKCEALKKERYETRVTLYRLLKAFESATKTDKQERCYLEADYILDKYYHVDDVLRNEAISGEGDNNKNKI